MENVGGIYNNAVKAMKNVNTKIVEVRINAIEELENYISLNDYYENEKNEIENILIEAKQNIDSSTDESYISTIVANAKAKIDSIETKIEKDAALIAQAKINAKDEINNYITDLSDYRDSEKQTINSIKANASSRIDGCTNLDDLNNLIIQLKKELDDVKTNEELIIEELNLAKNTAILELDNYVRLDDYYVEEKEIINKIIKEAKTLINNSKNIDEIDPIVSNAKIQIDNVKTKDVIYLEKLTQAKSYAKGEIDSYKSNEEYFDSELTLITSLKNEAKSSIDSSDSIQKIEALINKLKAEIDSIPTKKAIEKLHFEDSKAKELSNINNYLKLDNYYAEQVNQINAILNSAENINYSTKNNEELYTTVKELKQILDSIKTKNEIEQDRFQNELAKIIERINNYVESLDNETLNDKQINDINNLKTQYIEKIKKADSIDKAKDYEQELLECTNNLIQVHEKTDPVIKTNPTLIIIFSIMACLTLIGLIATIMLFRKKKIK